MPSRFRDRGGNLVRNQRPSIWSNRRCASKPNQVASSGGTPIGDTVAGTQPAATQPRDFVSVRPRPGCVVLLSLPFFIHAVRRRVVVWAPTASPHAAWVAQQARNASMEMTELGQGATHLLIDHDVKYEAGFDAVFEADEVEVKRVGPRASNMTRSPSGGCRH